MAPAPKKPTALMDLVNSRGVLSNNSAAKLLGKVLRDVCVPKLEATTSDHQFGSVRAGGCTDVASMCVRAVLEYGKQTGTSLGVVFADLRAAFYTCLTGEVVGPLLADPSRQAALECADFTSAGIAEF